MPELTSKELDAICDQLSAEELLVKKYQLFAQVAEDPQLKTKCEQIAAKHQNHFDRLLNQLN